MRLRVGDRFQGSLASAAQGGVLPRATKRRELSSQSIMSFETIGKAHIAWGSNIGQKADGGVQIGLHSQTRWWNASSLMVQGHGPHLLHMGQ